MSSCVGSSNVDEGMVQLILKVASRCNLNCSYCYVYNKGDSSWRDRPTFMSDKVFDAALDRTLEYCRMMNQRCVSLVFHGGEPCLVGVSRLSEWCRRARNYLAELNLAISIQTNGTLIDDRWIEAFLEHSMGVGVSIDGPPQIHDRFRVDHAGRGSHAQVTATIRMLNDAGVQNGLLCVVPLGSDAVAVHRHLSGLGASSLTYLLPDYTHETIGEVRQVYGETPCADFLVAVFDEWWFNQTLSFEIRDLKNVARVIMGGESLIETIGNRAPHYFFVETDGAIEGLDALRVCENGIYGTNLNVQTAKFVDVRRVGGLHAAAIFESLAVPTPCRGCEEVNTCAGGHLPHRYSRQRSFDNESVWCADLKKLFAHVRARLDVTPNDTLERRRSLEAKRRALAATEHCAEKADGPSIAVRLGV